MTKLRDIRLSAGKTLKDIADDARISISALSYYERGGRKPRYPTKAAIARALDVPEDSIDWDCGE